MTEWSEHWSRNPVFLGLIPALATEIVFVWVPIKFWSIYNFSVMLCI